MKPETAFKRLYDNPTAETLSTAAIAHAAGLGRYLSPEICELCMLAFIAQWLADRDDPAAHVQIAVDATRLIILGD